MIRHWELISQIDDKTKSIRYSLVMDGTEKDSRLMAKKLKGIVRGTYDAVAPYVYGFVLPNDMDENTQEKIRTAAKEVVDLSQKIDHLVPGGNLGDPLFNATDTDINKSPDSPAPAKQFDLEDASRLNLHTTNQSAASKQSTQKPEEIEQIDLSQQTVSMPATADASGTLSISDDDMLINGMEGSVLEKMPIEDILSAETRYDMFMDVDQTAQQVKQTQQDKAQKISDAHSSNAGSFNVFENELKDQTNIIDIEDVETITDRLAKKDKTFMNNINPSQENEQNHSADPQTDTAASSTPSTPFTLGAAQEPPRTMMDEFSSEMIPEEEQLLDDTLPPQASEQSADLPEITVRADMDKLDKTFNLETTFNTEFLKKQDEKIRSLREGKPVQEEQENPKMKTILRLKKQPPKAPQNPTDQPGKTILRLRRKNNIPDAPGSSAAKPLRSTLSPNHAAAKQGNIDHSIQIPTSELKKHNWPLEVPLVPTYTLNNMVMSVNRFAHATAISVIENPGKLYNPLVLHGGTGTGKTHFLNALAYAFSKKFGQEHIFMTNGVRLSRGIQRYVMEGNIDKFENFMKSVNALLIDDIHLLAINEQNRAYVSKLLNGFLQEKKQIVITSKYPPESLEKLEELIQFRLDSGWISELKPATGATHFRIVKKMLFENGVDLNDKQIEEFFSAPHMTLGTVTRSIRRLKVLENLIFPNVPAEEKSQAGIFEKLLATKGEDKKSELLTKDPAEITTLSMSGNGEWGRIGSDMMNWMVYALDKRAKELGIEGGFEIVVRSSYATENIISSAFKIANLCDNKKLKGAVILGPKPNSCDPSVRENFYDILTHMLEIMLIRCGIINYEDVRLPSTYVKVLSELMR